MNIDSVYRLHTANVFWFAVALREVTCRSGEILVSELRELLQRYCSMIDSELVEMVESALFFLASKSFRLIYYSVEVVRFVLLSNQMWQLPVLTNPVMREHLVAVVL